MAMIVMKKDLAGTFKKETLLNVAILSKLQPIFPELKIILTKDNALEKPTQTLFNYLCYYLVSIIDSQACKSFTWPLYDTKAERAFRSELSNFINAYSSKGLLAPVLSSYLVNPSSYKVTVLLYQLSQLAVNEMVKKKVNTESQKRMYNEMSEKYKLQKDNVFVECINKETEIMLSKFSLYLCKRKLTENMAALLRKRIVDMDNKLKILNSQDYINKLVEVYVNNNVLDEEFKTEILKIKNINEQSTIFDSWLLEVDKEIDKIEAGWNQRVIPFLNLCHRTYEYTDNLIKIFTGEVESSSYMIEYDPKSDPIHTEELQKHVNSEQKFILKNLVNNGRLNFPNLVRAYIISISIILSNGDVGDQIAKFNEYLEISGRNYKEVVLALRTVVERILNAEKRLQYEPTSRGHVTISSKFPDIPPLPDLSDLKINNRRSIITFTPLNINKQKINLLNKTNEPTVKPQLRHLAPLYRAPKDDFLKSLISCRVSSYDQKNEMQCLNISTVSYKVNETVAECTGFTKQQILRLLSTKKSSIKKKFKNKQERPNINRRVVFNESDLLNDSSGLFRSYSSPNLYENREQRPFNRARGRKLSVMTEHSPQFNVSGISTLGTDSNFNTPQGFGIAESSRKEIETSNIPVISITNEAEERLNIVLDDVKNDLASDLVSPILAVSTQSMEEEIQPSKLATPPSNTNLIKKTSSLEKIINRFKKVRATVIPGDNEIKTVIEEKENISGNSKTIANRILLPDLLSPSCSTFALSSNGNTNYLDQLWLDMDKAEKPRPRESLGTALGVDNTILDQFPLID